MGKRKPKLYRMKQFVVPNFCKSENGTRKFWLTSGCHLFY